MTMLDTTWIALREHARIRAIVAVLMHYGVEDVAVRLGLAPLLRRGERAAAGAGAAAADLALPQRVCLAIEALGPTFVKLGQVLATRGDLLPAAWTDAFARLHSHASVLPWETIRPGFLADLGVPLEAAFAEFDTTPLAAASIAQVYRARLHTGQAVVVKVQRPGLRQTMEADLRLLAHLASLVQEQGALARYRPRDIVRHLASAMADELDFTREAQAGERVRERFADEPSVVIPAVYWAWTSERILVQDFVDGVSPEDTDRLREAGLDGALMAERGARAFLKMALQDGFFHADPHPGNLLALPGDRVAFIDFGLVGHLSPRRRDELLRLLRAILDAHAEDVADVLLGWSAAGDVDWPALEEACEAYVARNAQGALSLERALREFLALARNAQLALPADLALLFKALITAEGVLRQFDPAFDVVRVARPVVEAALRERYSPRTLRRQAWAALSDVQWLAGEAPRVARLVLHRLKHGRLDARVEVANLTQLGRSLERSATRLAVAIVTAAFVLALAPLLLDVGPRWFGVPVFALLGLLAAVGGLVSLLWSSRRP